MDECESVESNDCHFNASCNNTEGSYTCRCLGGYQGDGKNCTGKYHRINWGLLGNWPPTPPLSQHSHLLTPRLGQNCELGEGLVVSYQKPHLIHIIYHSLLVNESFLMRIGYYFVLSKLLSPAVLHFVVQTRFVRTLMDVPFVPVILVTKATDITVQVGCLARVTRVVSINPFWFLVRKGELNRR